MYFSADELKIESYHIVQPNKTLLAQGSYEIIMLFLK